MPRSGDRGGGVTRSRIAEVATRLFLEQGFDAVTIAQVAAAAGVSKVTVFAHFSRKEDLLLDRVPQDFEQLRSAVRHRAPGVGALDAVRRLALELPDAEDSIIVLKERARPFFRTVAHSASLCDRARELCAELEAALAEELRSDDEFRADPELAAALTVAAWRTAFVVAVRHLLDGGSEEQVVDEYRTRAALALDAAVRGIEGEHAAP